MRGQREDETSQRLVEKGRLRGRSCVHLVRGGQLTVDAREVCEDRCRKDGRASKGVMARRVSGGRDQNCLARCNWSVFHGAGRISVSW